MITNINGGPYIAVTNGNPAGPYISNYNNQSMVGMVRYNGNHVEVYDGSTWLILSTPPVTIDLTGSANAAIAWAMSKMEEEAELQRMADNHPAVKAAYENLKRSAEQLKTTIILSKNEETTS
jgi:hypothetical protein